MCRQRGCGVDVLGEGRRGPWGGCVGRGAVGGRCPHAPCPRRHRAAPAPPVEPGGGAGGAQRAARGEEHPGGRAGGAQLGATCGGGDPGGAVAGGTLGLCQAGLVPPAGGRGLGSPDGPPTPQGAGETGAPAAAARPPAEGVRGGDTAGAIAKYSPHVVSFALGPSAGGEPAGQDGGLSGTTSPSPASLVHHLEPLKDKLSVSRIHQARAQLRALLEEECQALERHVCHLQRCLEEEHGATTGPMQPAQEPTMAELQEQRRAMERDLQQGQSEPGPGFCPGDQRPGPAPPWQPSCPEGLGSPAPASVCPGLAPTWSRLGPAPSAPGSATGPVPPSLGSLARGRRGWASGQGQTDGSAECQDRGAAPRGAGAPPAGPACSLAFLPSPPTEQRPPPRPISCRRLRLLGCQAPG
ncbi:coiled-coil domain-containing protein 24 isoform X1 [Pelodiscus sinensis]|uniref:coiled-coil domain-containing protein 24 isoform X1 n=1 Tax=Pelodiscus sinensis TaxID=13735 RepID=UPI003F6D75D0